MSNKIDGFKRGLRTIGLGLAIAVGLSGCVAHARGEIVYDYPVAYVDVAPARIEHYPRTVYHGRPAYLVDGRWYYHTDRSWVYFREEPTELRAYRSRQLPAYAAGPGRAHYAESRSVNRAEVRRNDQRRAAEHRADQRRDEERRQAEHRAEARRNEERRAADHRADVRRIEERQAAERRADQDRRVAEQRRAHDSKKKERSRRDPRNRHDDDRNGRDRDRRND